MDPTDINGKYSHKIYGYLQPQQAGEYGTALRGCTCRLVEGGGGRDKMCALDALPWSLYFL